MTATNRATVAAAVKAFSGYCVDLELNCKRNLFLSDLSGGTSQAINKAFTNIARSVLTVCIQFAQWRYRGKCGENPPLSRNCNQLV
jgi:hypothetical protein